MKGQSPIIRRRWQRRHRRNAFRQQGLTHDGKVRQRGTWTRYPELDGLPPKARAVARAARWRARERYAKGLTQRGKLPGKPGRRPKRSSTELDYQKLRAGMNIVLPEVVLSGREREVAA